MTNQCHKVQNRVEDHRSDRMSIKQSNVNTLDYFRSSTNIMADKEASRLLTQKINNEFNAGFTGIGCFEALQAEGVRRQLLLQGPTQGVAYALKQPLKEELDHL